MRVMLRLLADRRLNRSMEELTFGHCRLLALPTADPNKQEFTLDFTDMMFEQNGGSYAEKEGEYISELISLLYDVKIDVIGCALNNVDCSDMIGRRVEGEAVRVEDIEPVISQCLSGLIRCSETIVKQYIRSMHAYSLAVRCISLDRALAFVLFVTAIEALSSREEIIPAAAPRERDAKKAERFCQFVLTYCEDASLIEGNGETTVKEDLKTIYYVARSAFLHGGAEVSLGSSAADKGGMRSFPVVIDGKEKLSLVRAGSGELSGPR